MANLTRSLMAGAAIALAAASGIGQPFSPLVDKPRLSVPVRAPSKKRPKPIRRPRVLWKGSGAAKNYMSRRSFPAGATSTLRKTAKLLRLQAGGF